MVEKLEILLQIYGYTLSQGTDVKVLTEVIKSVSKIDHIQHSGGTVLNLKLNSASMRER